MSRTYESSVSPKGQVTLPIELRRRLGIKTKNRVTITEADDAIVIRPAESLLLKHYGRAGKLREPLTWRQVEEIAHEDHADKAVREELER